MTTTMKPILSVTVAAADFVAAIKSLMPFASKDPTLPMLNGVHIEKCSAGRTRVAATDRFVLGATTIGRSEWTVEGDGVILPLELCKQIVATWRTTSARYPMTLTIEVWPVDADGIRTTVSVTDQMGVCRAEPNPLKQDKDGKNDWKFPDVVKLIGGTESADQPAGTVGFNMDNLDRVKHLHRPGDHTVFHWPEKLNRPLLITVGRHSAAIVMPVRLNDETTPSVDDILGGAA